MTSGGGAEVGGNATLAGVDVKAGTRNLAVKGTTTVEKRTDSDTGSSSSLKLRGGVVSQPGSGKKAGESEKPVGAAAAKASAKTTVPKAGHVASSGTEPPKP